MHFNGQSTIQLDGDRATGESYCIAHHLYAEEGTRMLMVAWLRYLDVFVKGDRPPGDPELRAGGGLVLRLPHH